MLQEISKAKFVGIVVSVVVVVLVLVVVDDVDVGVVVIRGHSFGIKGSKSELLHIFFFKYSYLVGSLSPVNHIGLYQG